MGTGVTGAPTLPSLLKENTVGYDAELVTIDFVLLLQFKRSFFVSRQHSQRPCGYLNNGNPHCTWAHWNSEHYRFDVDTNSIQFHIMRGYEADIALGYRAGLALYAAPAFDTQADFNDAYAKGVVLDQSVGILPSEFDVVARGMHQYSFDRAVAAGVVTSEPVEVAPKAVSDAIAEASQRGASRREEPLTLSTLGSWVANQASVADIPGDFDRRSAPDTVRFLNDFAGLLGAAFSSLADQTNLPSPTSTKDPHGRARPPGPGRSGQERGPASASGRDQFESTRVTPPRSGSVLRASSPPAYLGKPILVMASAQVRRVSTAAAPVTCRRLCPRSSSKRSHLASDRAARERDESVAKPRIVCGWGNVRIPDARVSVLDEGPDFLDAVIDRTYVAGKIAEDDELVWDDAARSVTASYGIRKAQREVPALSTPGGGVVGEPSECSLVCG